MLQCDNMKDDEGPSNTLEHFTEFEQVLQMIDSIQAINAAGFERDFEQYTEVLTRYQEQPHLLDSHMDILIKRLLLKIRNTCPEVDVKHAAFKYLYIICKVRTYKAFVKFLPHELSDLEFVLNLMEKQNPKEFSNWETRYMLLLWLSILVLNPFHMVRLDAYIPANNATDNITKDIQHKPKMERIYDLCKRYTTANDTCSNMAAFLAAKFFVRIDIKDVYLKPFIDWIISQHQTNFDECKYGQLAAIAGILKHCKREDLLPYTDNLLKWIISYKYNNDTDFLKYKIYMKIVQRLGLVYLKPRIANWRYNRGTRSLTMNLNLDVAVNNRSKDSYKANEEESFDEELIVPDAIEDVIEELLQGLRSGGNDIRWSAAKGVGRVANRLSKELADEVIGSVIDILSPMEPHEAWHGGCLALAELAKRGLLLPIRLRAIIPLLMKALFYDEMKGYMSVGQHIRDSACYMCWAFARSYNPEDFQPFVNEVSAGLLTVAVFDREINCRRAASAAFQESVGRLGNFPHGIEISTATDFYSVGLRQNAYLNISDFIAQYEQYRYPLISHLVEYKVNHWDTSIRELASKALHKLTHRSPEYMSTVVMCELFDKCNSIDINTRHGSILALGEITLALKELQSISETNQPTDWLTQDIICKLNELIGNFLKRELFRGMSGEMMKISCSSFIKNCSIAKISVSQKCIESWQDIINKCLLSKNASIRESATLAFAELCRSYYCNEEKLSTNADIIKFYLNAAKSDLDEHVRMGYISALGVLPAFMIKPHLDDILANLIEHSLIPDQTSIAGDGRPLPNKTLIWSEARRDSVKALNNLVQTIGFSKGSDVSFAQSHYLNKVLQCLLKAMNEYTLDNRGDIGAWVREAAMNAIYQLLINSPKELLEVSYVCEIINGFMQQSVEKIDRTRGLAARLLCQLIHSIPEIPHIKHHESLKKIFPSDVDSVLWLFADHTFPLFCSLLDLPDYTSRILLGLSASMGQLTESLIRYSSSAFFQYLRTHPNDVKRICEAIANNFEENSLNERVTYPMINFLDIVIASGTINKILLDETHSFSDDIYRLLNIEIKGMKKLYKLTSSINVFCHLVQVPHLNKKILTKMSIFLGLTHVHIRKTTAIKLYEALAIHGEVCNISDENMEQILNLLSETDWGLPLVEVRPIRNELCSLMAIKAPVSLLITTTTTTTSTITASRIT